MKTWHPPLVVFCAALLVASPAALPQGSLTPPGAPAPTMKTLDQVEPRVDLQRAVNPLPNDADYHYIINAPGSYYLSANLAVTKPNGIKVTAPGATIDLNGFAITRGSGTGGNGITVEGMAHRCTVRDGTIVGFANGIECSSPFGVPAGGTFARLAVSGCSGAGLRAGNAWEIAGCKAQANPGGGIVGGLANVLRDCVASDNGGTGIQVIDGGTLSGCIAIGNAGSAGISAGDGSTLTHCAARANVGTDTASHGIFVGNAGNVVACVAAGNTNATATATHDTGAGIRVGSGSTVKDCTAQGNKGDGIQLSGRCLALHNQCDGNGAGSGVGAGVYAATFGNRIEANNLTGNDRGIEVTGLDNIILKNTVRNSSGVSYVIVGGNRYGPIVDLFNNNGPAVNGNFANSTLGTAGEHPWANFAY